MRKKNLLWLVPGLREKPFAAYIAAQDLTFIMSDDKALHQEYFSIRSQCYQNDLGLDHVTSEPDQFDHNSQIMIIKKGDNVIGGCRTVVCSPGNETLLPLEEEGFRVKEALPGLRLDKHSYSEMSRIAIMPVYRSKETFEYMLRFEIAYSKYHNIDYTFSNAPMVQTRAYKQITKKLGFDFTVLKEVAMPVQSVYQKLHKVVLSVMPFDESRCIDREQLCIANSYSHAQQEPITYVA